MSREKQKVKMLEVTLNDQDNFLKIVETLTRIGIPTVKEGCQILWQSCHILHKKQRYYICHFKELFSLDGRDTDIDDGDIKRRNLIASFLDEWGLCTPVEKIDLDDIRASGVKVKVVRYSDSKNWKLRSKYLVGKNAPR